MIIDWGEETIHKMNETPSDVECDSYRKKNDAANNMSFLMEHIYKIPN
jgi:hypothetical protein